MTATYEQVHTLIRDKNFLEAEKQLNTINQREDHWHFLYSILLTQKAWFESAKVHLEKAISMNPNQPMYQKSLARLMSRSHHYSNDYYNSPRYRRRSGCCCCCCDDCCCDFSCCDLICLDSCCECMGGDLISCI